MGTGVANAEALLAAIDGTEAAPMTFPNVTLTVGADRQVNPAIYFENGTSLTYNVSIADQSVAAAKVENGKVVISAKTVGQTTAVIKGGSEEQKNIRPKTLSTDTAEEGISRTPEVSVHAGVTVTEEPDPIDCQKFTDSTSAYRRKESWKVSARTIASI